MCLTKAILSGACVFAEMDATGPLPHQAVRMALLQQPEMVGPMEPFLNPPVFNPMTTWVLWPI